MKERLKKMLEKLDPLKVFKNEIKLGYVIGCNEGLDFLTISDYLYHEFDYDVMRYNVPDKYSDKMAEILATIEEYTIQDELLFRMWGDFDEILHKLGEKYDIRDVFVIINDSNLRMFVIFPIESIVKNYEFDEEAFIEELITEYNKLPFKENLDFETYLEENEHLIRNMLVRFLRNPSIRALIKEFENELLKTLEEYERKVKSYEQLIF
ncbi:MAG: hypothetical protein RMI01_09115 [Thermodesulfovibrio sp.]|nr:hypothetical protein [Thermodesulfovibrio sp.]